MSDTDTLLHRVLLVLDVQTEYVRELQQQPIDKDALMNLLHRRYAVAVGVYDPADDLPATPAPAPADQLERAQDDIADLRAAVEELTARVDAEGAQRAAIVARLMNMAVEVGRLGQSAERCRECVWANKEITNGRD